MPFPVNPSAEYFTRPADLEPGYGTIITDEGHIYGYLTVWNSRLVGSGTKNTKPPRSRTQYAYANAFNTKCEDGSIVRTGVLAGEGGHHYKGGFKPSQEAYADVKHKIARVVYGEDKHGVWFSGALCAHVDEGAVEQIRSSGVSGHWERPGVGKPLELLGACVVNIPGFAQASNHRIAASASFTPTGGLILTPISDDGADGTHPELPAEISRRVHAAGSRITAAGGRMVPVSGVLAALGTPTVDGRQVNNVQYDRLPLPLWFKKSNGGWGHEGATVVGRIDEISIDGSLVTFTGVIDQSLEDAEGAEAVSDLNVLGISMDGTPDPDSEVIVEYDDDGWPNRVEFEMYNIYGATLCMEPAFRETLGVATGEDAEGTTSSGEDEDEASTEEDSGIAAAAGPDVQTIKPPIVWH